jgi:hypothetical protein
MTEQAKKRREKAGDIVRVETGINTRLFYEILHGVGRARELNNTTLHCLVNDANSTIAYTGQC